METEGRKRLRANENLDLTSSTSDTFTSKGELADASTIPSLVLNIFLARLTDVELLKTCRLVCSSWNNVATDSLRICSVVRLKENSPEKLNDFRTILLRRSFGPLQHLTSPFRNFHAEGQNFTDPTFINLLFLPNIAITSLDLTLCDFNAGLDQLQLGRILAVNKTNITDLTVLAGSHFLLNVLVEELLANDQVIQLTALKRLQFHDFCNVQCVHIQFMKVILSMCKPESMDLEIRDGKLLMSLLHQHNVENLKHLVIDFWEMPTEVWEHLDQLKFLRLTTLTFKACYPERLEDHPQQLRLFYQHLPPTLAIFNTNVRISTESEIWLPNLETIKVQNNTSLSAFSPNRFPVLSKLVYNVREPLLSNLDDDAFPNHEVLSVDINLMLANPGGNEAFDQDLLILLTYVARQFPEVSVLGFCSGTYRCNTLPDIYESFPKLAALGLDGNCDFFSFSGMRNSMVTKYFELGWPIEKIPRRKSIVDFIELENIFFGPKFVVHPDMIIHCLPRVPNLRRIGFHWNESLSAPLLRDSVGHLKRLTIFNSSESRFHDAMVQLSAMLPNVYLS